MRIAELMQRDVITVGVDTQLKDVAALLLEHRISGVPVVLPDGRLAGVVSEADILFKEAVPLANEPRGFSRLLDDAYGDLQRWGARNAGDAMTSPAVTIESRREAADAARLMTEKHINRLPVVDAGRLVGIVTRADLVRAFCRSDEEIADEIRSDVLLATLWIDPDDVEVLVRDGVVTLRGTLESKTIAGIVAAYVRRVPGVVDVRSWLAWARDDTTRRRQTLAGRIPHRV
jgi:CBS domain-containing protein